MHKKLKKTVQRVSALIVLFSIVVTMFGCDSTRGIVPSADVVKVIGEIKEQKTDVKDKSLHLIDPLALDNSMASSGLMEIFLDDNSFGIALFEKTKQKYWYSLPIKENTNYDYSASTVTIDVLCGNTLYKLNSQDDSVAYGNISCEVLGDGKRTGFTVTYIITADAKTAAKITSEQVINETIPENAFAKTDIVFEVKVTYELLDGNLYVSAQQRNVSNNTDAYLLNLSLLPFFGASDSAENGDFMLVPDGCGAVINTAVNDTSFKPISFEVYGDNFSADSNKDDYSAFFPAFGAKQGDNAFAVIIEKGDAIATINVDRKNGKTGFNTVGTSFCVTEYETVQDDGKTVTYVNKETYSGDIRLCIRLLGGASSGYDGLAAACREQFMRTGYMSVNTVENEQYLPFNLGVVGSVGGDKRTDRVKTLTTFEEAQDMLFRAKSKGINNINVRYMGVSKSGINQKGIGTIDFAFSQGGKREFETLHEFTVAQGHSLFVDTAIFSWNDNKITTQKKAMSVFSLSTKLKTENILGDVFATQYFSRNLLRLCDLENNIISLLNDANDIQFDGFCITDASSLLYSDYSKGYTDRQTAMENVRENLTPMSTDRILMVESCNLYSLKNADIIFEIPVTTKVAERDGLYEAVPFLQMILHGTVDYSVGAVNLSQDKTYHMLKSVEYGACPSYVWCFSEKGTDKYCYAEQLNEASLYYTRASEVLSDLRDARIVDNGETQTKGVRFTEYDNGAIIYVNYNDTEAKINNITIDANSFIRIG